MSSSLLVSPGPCFLASILGSASGSLLSRPPELLVDTDGCGSASEVASLACFSEGGASRALLSLLLPSEEKEGEGAWKGCTVVALLPVIFAKFSRGIKGRDAFRTNGGGGNCGAGGGGTLTAPRGPGAEGRCGCAGVDLAAEGESKISGGGGSIGGGGICLGEGASKSLACPEVATSAGDTSLSLEGDHAA